ncbi:alpha/beta hydrolase [Nocardia sp. NPDC060249]|uniref:alpha/beta hydrolase n=1 Tax=Nocardia sp. NPDC060249 TaxID=3347082 RepID=UPI003660447E
MTASPARLRTLHRRLLGLVTTLGIVAALTAPGVASAATATVDHRIIRSERWEQLYVFSPAMGRVVGLDILHPTGTAPRPTLYLLDGTGAGNDQTQSTWTLRTDVTRFFADKNVNVVMPIGGGGTFYTDWLDNDSVLGHNRWEDFLTRELPPLINRELLGNGKNAIAGLSMGGHAAATLAFRNPGLYRAVGVYSGCLLTSDVGQPMVRAAVHHRGGNPDNMWGGSLDPGWAAHDPTKHLDALRDTAVYMSVGSGTPGPADVDFDPSFSYPIDLFGAISLEEGALNCTRTVEKIMRTAGLEPTVRYTLFGTHAWPYWQDALHSSWPTLRTGIGL